MNRTINKLKKDGFLTNVITLMTGTVIAQAIPIAISPLLTRIYSPEDFGTLALFISISSIIAVIITARYELAIMLPKDDEEALNLMGLSFLITLIMSMLLTMIVILYGYEIALLLGDKEFYVWLYFIPFYTFLTGIFQIFSYWSNRKIKYKRLSKNKVTRSLTTVGTNLSVGLIYAGPLGLILGNIISQFIATIHLIYTSIKNDKVNLKTISFTEIKRLASQYIRFPKYSIWSALLNTGSLQLPVFFLSFYFPGSIVGYYSLSQRILNMPMTLLGSAVAQVFYQSATSLSSKDKILLKSVTLKLYKNMLLIGVVPTALIFAFGDYIFGFVFGEEWTIAGDYARIISPWILLVFISSPLALLYTVLNKEKVLLTFNFFLFAGRSISLLIGTLIFKDALATVILFSIISSLFYLWNTIYILDMVKIKPLKTLLYTSLLIIGVYFLAMCIRYFFVRVLY